MEEIVEPLLKWYQKNKRDLPWRKDKNPYHVWISEIMLQQTRIEAVIQYYNRFMKELPTIQDLKKCDPDRLLKLWEGLGYYTRVKNIQASSRIIVDKYKGIFPTNYEEILSLPGIGEYTASAIASICFSKKEVTVDGNVLRVYMRLNNSYDNVDDSKVKKEVRKKLMCIIPENAGDFNQGMMELGERICLPNGEPKCNECPLKNNCISFKKNTYQELPVKNPKKNKKEEKYTIFLFYQNKNVFISKRTELGLLHNLWQFPNVEGHLNLKEIEEYLKEKNIQCTKIMPSISYTHVFTHKKWNMISYLIEVNDSNLHWITKQELEKFALPTAFQPFKKELLGGMNET